jgi:hypothetical protein
MFFGINKGDFRRMRIDDLINLDGAVLYVTAAVSERLTT